MNSRSTTHDGEPDGFPGAWSLEDSIRAAADGELPGDQTSRLLHGSNAKTVAAGIEFEQNLRLACARVFAGDAATAPEVGADLHATVQRIMVASRQASDSLETSPVHVHEAASRPAQTATAQTARGRRLARAGWIALAACTLIVGVVVGTWLATPAPTFNTQPNRTRIALVGFLESEHRRCALNERSLRNKMTVYAVEDVPAKFAGLLGQELSVSAVVGAGYEFLGCGKCAVPGRGESVHLMFRDPSVLPPSVDVSGVNAPRDAGRFSLFIQQDTDELPITLGQTYRLETGEGEPLVIVWRNGGLVYYMVCESESQQEQVTNAMGVVRGLERL